LILEFLFFAQGKKELTFFYSSLTKYIKKHIS